MGIAEVIAGAIRGIVEGGLSFANKADKERTTRIIGYNQTRQSGALTRNLPVIIFSVIAIVLLIIFIAKK